MRPHLSVLFLMALPSLLHLTGSDGQGALHGEKKTEIVVKSDVAWEVPVGGTRFLSLSGQQSVSFFPKNSVVTSRSTNWWSWLTARKASLVLSTANKAQPETRPPPNSQASGLELLQRLLEAPLSGETGRTIRFFGIVTNITAALGTAFHEVLASASPDGVRTATDAPFVPLMNTVAALVAIARDDFRARFPLPATAPGHAERAKRVSATLAHLQQRVVRLARDHGIGQGTIEYHLTLVKPFSRDVGILVGDVAELYPAAIEALVLNLSAIMLPKAMFLRSLVILYCYGPYELGKDVISGWLLKHV